MQQEVPASTRIKDKSIRNVDTDRLCRRRDFLIANRDRIARESDSRIQLRVYARELYLINQELLRRR
jgi:hypothetical protein